ncbi:MAG TPA: transposase [Bryobacteraceae bacterium]|nr:transposase [Bryobacteraceae bacterium]
MEWTWGDKTSRYCVLNEAGEVLSESCADNEELCRRRRDEERYGAAVATMAGCRVAIEVGTHSPWVSRELTRFGHEAIVANARQVKLISQSSRKNDKPDAQMLARLARMDPWLLRLGRHRSEERRKIC